MKIREIFCENLRIIFILFYDVHKENMFTINLGDGREAPSKARKKGAKRLEFLVLSKYLVLQLSPGFPADQKPDQTKHIFYQYYFNK